MALSFHISNDREFVKQPTTPRLFVDGAEVQCQTLDTHREDPHGVAFYSIDGGDWFAATIETILVAEETNDPASNGAKIEWLETLTIHLTKI